jgi:hypothetical protein
MQLRQLHTRSPYGRGDAELMGWKRDIEDLGLFLAAIIVVLMMFVGCGIQLDPARILPPPPRAAEATSVVLAFYHANGNGMPPITWYSTEPDGPCAGSFTAPDGSCVDGLEVNGWGGELGNSGRIVVGVYPDLARSWIILAHEIAHWRYDADGHPAAVFGDFDHTGIDGGAAGDAESALTRWETGQ